MNKIVALYQTNERRRCMHINISILLNATIESGNSFILYVYTTLFDNKNLRQFLWQTRFVSQQRRKNKKHTYDFKSC